MVNEINLKLKKVNCAVCKKRFVDEVFRSVIRDFGKEKNDLKTKKNFYFHIFVTKIKIPLAGKNDGYLPFS